MINGHALITSDGSGGVQSNWIYDYIPFEVFFAIADSVKYIQGVFIAKWVDRKFLMVPFGLWFILMGMSKWPRYLYLE